MIDDECYYKQPHTSCAMHSDPKKNKAQEKMADHSHRPRRLNYGNVQLFKKDTLGIGSYGMVCKAMCGQLPCAAKLLHDTLFHHGDPGEYDLMAKFEQECQFLSGIHHPNIVQYLCTLRDRDSRRPVLLMELMEENLTKFLGRSTKPLPYHLQVGISRDISLALSYLHLNGIIHRDLSSNNILLTAEKRAKVTDFGMSKFADAGSRKTLTQMPGTQVYMPPEAKTTPPRYTDKLDCFSLGVLMIQIATRKFPEPSEATELVEVNDPRFQSNRVMVFIPEQKRRQEHIGEIEPGHPLLHTALKCIADEEDNRPTSLTICNDLTKENAHFQRGLEDERRKSEAEEKQHREEVRNLNRKLGEANKDIAYFRGRVMELEQEVFDLRNRLKRNEEATKARERDLENTKQSYQGEVERLRRELEKVYAETRREKLPERALHSSPNQPNDPYPANRQLQPRANQPPRQDRPAYIPTHKPPSSVTQDPDTHRLRDGPAYFPTHKPPSPVAQDPDTHRLRGGPVYDQPRHAPLQPIPPFKAGSVPGPAYNQPYAASRQPLATSQNPNSNRSSSYSLPRKPTPMAAMPPSAHRPSSHAAPGQPLALNHVPTAGRLQPAPRYPPPRQDYPAARSPSVPGRPIYDKPQQPLPATSVQPPPLARVPSAPAIIRPNSTPQPQPPQPPPPQPPPNPAPEQVPNTWRVRTQALEQITGSTGQAIAHRKVLYFTQNYIPYAYHEREDRWEELPRCKNKEFAVAIVSDKLTAVGGLDTRGLQSSTIFTLQYRKWERVLPALPRARAHPAALTTPTQHLVVAGGTYVSENSHAGYKEVEVLNLVTKQWFEVSSLPEVARYPQLMLTNNNNILLYDTEKNKLYGCLLDVLLEQAPGGGAWAQQAPVENVKEGASLAQVGDCLLAIGGKDKAGKPCSEIYCYNAQNDMWSYVKDMLTPRSWTLSAVAPGNVLVVVGGFKNQACTLTETIVVDFL